MNNIDTILQSADLPELPVEAISDERQANILSGALQLVHQDAKKRSRRRVVRIVAAAAAAIAVLCGAAAIWHYASVSTEETVYHTEDTRTLSDGTEVTYFEDLPVTRSSALTRRAGRKAPTAACSLAGCRRRWFRITPHICIMSSRTEIPSSWTAYRTPRLRWQRTVCIRPTAPRR